MLKWFRRKKRESEFPFVPPAPPDASGVAASMREAEAEGMVDPGKALHVLAYDELTLRIDRDVVGMIRLTASQGNERRFSFSFRCSPDQWEGALEQVFEFLASERVLKSLPDSVEVKGYFYGYD